MSQNINSTTPNPVCVTAFIAPKSLVELDIYNDGLINKGAATLSVGVYMSDRSIRNIGTFTNAASALSYAFKLKSDNCPISKNAFAIIQAEIKRTDAVHKRAKARVEKKSVTDIDSIQRGEVDNNVQMLEVSLKGSIEKRFNSMKKKHPDAILLFRVGDFYETLHQDAEAAADVLGITLTKRKCGKKDIFLAGFPHHALDCYLPKLVRAGKRVAICEQINE